MQHLDGTSSNRLHPHARIACSTQRGLLTLVLCAFPVWLALAPAPAFAALDGAECWADGLCQINGCQTPDPDCGGPPDLPREIPLTISRYITSTLDNATADLILAEASDVLQTNNGGVGDVACDVTFARNGGVTTFSATDGSIDSEADFNAVIALSGRVKVVNQITWCGGFGANIIGCAPRPGTSQVVVRWVTIHQEGILWAHEYGHTQGLPDRTTANYVMSGTLSARSTRVSATECDAYLY
ncbi:MAG TPA: hypothetical protein VI542_03065 [Candidatus Tectomicrobia bacterium]